MPGVDRAIRCQVCGSVAQPFQDERTSRIGWSCPDNTCAGARSFIDPTSRAKGGPDA